MKQLFKMYWQEIFTILLVAVVLLFAIIVMKQPRILVTKDSPWYQSTK